MIELISKRIFSRITEIMENSGSSNASRWLIVRKLPREIYTVPINLNDACWNELIQNNVFEFWGDSDKQLCVKMYFNSLLAYKRCLEYLQLVSFNFYKIHVISPGQEYTFMPCEPVNSDLIPLVGFRHRRDPPLIQQNEYPGNPSLPQERVPLLHTRHVSQPVQIRGCDDETDSISDWVQSKDEAQNVKLIQDLVKFGCRNKYKPETVYDVIKSLNTHNVTMEYVINVYSIQSKSCKVLANRLKIYNRHEKFLSLFCKNLQTKSKLN